MKTQLDELTSSLLKQLQNLNKEVEQQEVGRVLTVGDGIVTADGLDGVVSGELVVFPNGTEGMVLNLETNAVGIILLEEDGDIKEGVLVRRTGKVTSVGVGDALLGRVVNPLGMPIDGLGEIKHTKFRAIERVAPGVMERKSVSNPLQTGIKAIDAMIPIGRGQRELIIGDRQTGKTSIAVDAIINQKGQNMYCVYVAIGQKNANITQLYHTLEAAGAMEYTVILTAGASELSPLQYIAPYAGCSIAEEWMEQGKDVLIVYDDLTKHAISYRTISLLLRRPPGREAYPGDVFYLHSRLLERAGRLNEEKGGGSITALPIIETQAGDISAFIPTNVISITDGQIFLQTDLFNAGQRPAIATGLSVSRVGGSAQKAIIKKLSGTLKIELAQYFELQSFSQFGSSVDDYTKSILNRGRKIQDLLKQQNNNPLSMVEQVFILFAIKEAYIDKIPDVLIFDFEKSLLDFAKVNSADLCNKIIDNPELTDEIKIEIAATLDAFMEIFSLKITNLDN
ncbi:F0F1 ATP synthase subunit alpha [Erysipelotrichaceae bacterium]|nr:F0F1 ATP synthase subunit alpha [Erysipelotrichaceae bacterium]